METVIPHLSVVVPVYRTENYLDEMRGFVGPVINALRRFAIHLKLPAST
jgi:hypothetical protein